MSNLLSRIGLRPAVAATAMAVALVGVPAAMPGTVTAQAGFDAQQGQGRGGGRGAGGGRGQTRDNLATPIGTSSIQGGVYSLSSGAPVRRAEVRLTGAELRGGRATTTNDEGLFQFVGLPAGRYSLTAAKPGYVNNAYGARSPGRPGTPIQLGEGQKLEKANISLPRGSVITGVVIDDTGDPAPGTQVRVMRYVIQSGERSVQQAGVDTTDDRGMYRVYGLQPGEYLVSAIPRNQNQGALRQAVMQEVEALIAQAGAAGGGRGGRGGGALGTLAAGGGSQALIERAAELQQQLQTQDDEQSVAYAPVFYPGTASPSSASSVTIGIGEERVGVDFQLQLVQTAQVSGQIVAYDGSLPPGVQVNLVPADTGGFGSLPGMRANSSRVNQTGEFSFENVTPGQYSLQARATIREVDPNAPEDTQGRGRGGFGGRGGRGGGPILQVLWAAMDISVSGTDLPGMVLNLQPGMTVSGQIQFDGNLAGVPQDLSNARVTLTPRGQQVFDVGGNPPAQVDATGRFTITGVAPGHYTISANVNGGGRGGRGGGATAVQTTPAANVQWSLASARVGGIEALDFPFEVAPNQDIGGALLTFSDRTQSVSGVLQDPQGRPVPDFTIVVFPSEEQYWLPQARRIASTRPDTDGRFRVNNLPPGNYRIAAIIDAEPGEWYNPDFLQQLRAASIDFVLSPGENKVQDIRMAGGS